MAWSSGGSTNAQTEIGADWIFGGWAGDEERWLLDTYNRYVGD